MLLGIHSVCTEWLEIYQEVGSCFDAKLEQGRVVLRVDIVVP